VKRRVGPAWLERAADDSGWVMRRGRVPEGYFDEKRATVRMAELIAEHDREERAIEAGERERRERGVTFRELAAEWLEHLQHERGAKPSTLSDYRYMLAEPGAPHRRGKGKSPGILMAAFGDRPAAKITTREVSTFLRKLDTEGVSPRSVNKNRQVLSAIFGYACRVDTHGLPSNPVAATTKRREPPAAVLDFYEPEEVETIALRSRRRVTPWRTAGQPEYRRDRVAGTRGRTGRRAVPPGRLHRPAPRRADRAALGGHRLRHAADGRPSRRVRRRGGADQELAGTLSAARRPSCRSPRTSTGPRRLHLTRGLRLLLAPRPAPRPLRRAAPVQGARDAAGLRPLRFHALRHAAGSLIARHADARFVQEFLGHSRITTTERYMHAKARPEDLERVNLAFAAK
jgi:site-specific recombinase XerD